MQANAFAAKFPAWRKGIPCLCGCFGISMLRTSKLQAQPKSRNIWSRPIVVGIIGLAMVGLLAGQAIAVTNITGVNVANKPDRVVISVQGSAPLKMAVLTSGSGCYLGFQFSGHLTTKGRLVSIHSGRIFNVRYSSFQERPPAARVVLNTSSHLDYSTTWNDDKTRVEITIWKFGASPSAKPERAVDDESGAQPAPDLLPMLPSAELGMPQDSEPGKLVDPTSAQPKVAPMAVARVAPAVVRVARMPAKPADPVSAQPKAAPMRTVRVAPAMVRVAPTPSIPAAFGAGKKVSLNFLGADIADVLKALSVQSGENIVVGSDVTGTITVTLDGVTVEEALDYITQLSGYTYVKDQHTYLVGSMESVGGLSNAKVEIVTLSYANADDVLEMLKTQCPQIRASKISVRGGLAKKHTQTFGQGKTALDTSSQANTTQGQANGNASGQADANSQGKANGADNSASGSATGQSAPNVQGSKSVDDTKSTESLASSTAVNSPPSNMIALVGTDEKIAAAKGFIAQVEDAMKNQGSDKKIGVYSVKYVNTQELANMLMSVVMGVTITLAPSAETGPIKSAQGQLIMPVNILSGENTSRAFDMANNAFSHTLIIVGSADDVQKALDTAVQFDVPGETDIATYKVKYVDPDLLAKTVRRLVPAVYVEGLGMTTALGGGDQSASGASGGANGAATPGGGSGSTPAGSGGGSQGTKSMTMDAGALNNLSRMLVITGRKGDVEKARTLIEALDVKSPQIKIEAKITSLSQTGEKKLGLSWSWGAFTKNEVSPSHWQRQPWDFAAKLDALITNGDGKLLAAPSLVCLEGKPGQFFVGDQIMFVTQISAAVNGTPTVTTGTADVGVLLSVVGNVASDGDITLNLHPEVSVVKFDSVNSPGLALTLPTITRRYTDHVVRVKSGETIVIGGLIKDDDLDTLSKVPILGDLPVLGHLFRHREKTTEHSEVVIFITASVVND